MKKENEVNIHKRQSVEEWEETQKEFTRRMEAVGRHILFTARNELYLHMFSIAFCVAEKRGREIIFSSPKGILLQKQYAH